MKKQFASLLVLFFFALSSSAQHIDSARIIFYNTENFFDTIKDPVTDDAEFTPEGKDHWTSVRYQHKLDNISKVLRLMTENVPPLFIGLAEIENAGVSKDLASQPNLQQYDLAVIEHDSPDPRGIDVALLYNRKLFTVTDTQFLFVKLPDIDRGTRDILYVKGLVNGNPLHVFVNHWPSRREGRQLSQPRRLAAAMVIKNKINQIKTSDSTAQIIIIGDLNDNPTDSTIVFGLNAIEPSLSNSPNTLYDLMVKPLRDGLFSQKYRGENDMFDQIIVTGNLLDRHSPIHLKSNTGQVFNERWLLFEHPKYGLVPNRTYTGTKYYGGFSDHLPVYIDVVF